MRSIYIRRLDPAKKRTLDIEYERLKVNCPGYADISRDLFDKCNNSIYIIEDRLISEYIGNFYGIIGARTLTMEEAKIEKLDFYCKPYYTNHAFNLVHEIEFMHFSYFRKINKSESMTLLKELIKYCIADQNDGFTVYRAKCDIISKEYEQALLDSNFEYHSKEFDAINDRYFKVYTRAPLMGKNPIL